MLRLLVLMLLWLAAVPLSVGPLQAQYDPTAPEPATRLRGSLLLHGGGTVSAEVRQRFVELAGGARARLVVIAPAVDEKQIAAWKSAEPAGMETVNSTVSGDALTKLLSEATGVWFQDVDPAAVTSETMTVAAALRAVVDRGGVVGGTSVGAALAGVVLLAEAGERRGIDLLPGAIVVPRFQPVEFQERLTRCATARPDHVGIGIPDETALVVQGRSLQVIGEAEVAVVLAATKQRPVRVDRLAAGQKADWIALNRAAQARARPEFPSAEPPPPQVEHGSLVIVGGGGMPAGLVQRFIELAGGPAAPLVVVPCMEQEVVLTDSFVETLRRAGARDVVLLHTKDRRKAHCDEEFLAPLQRARGVWFGGGRQWNLVDSYQNTTAHKLMHEVLERGGVIGGSSAGASIQGDYMPRGNPLGNREIMAEGYERGLGFLTGVAIDQHFAQRDRFADMTSLIQTHPQLLGIGIDEGTALIVRESRAEVVSKGNVAFYDSRRQDTDDDKDYLSVGAGRTFDLKVRRVVEAVSE